jgi:hypothetical protein
MSWTTNRLNASTETDLVAIARVEADNLNNYTSRKPKFIRLHGVGDCSTNETADIVSEAAENYLIRTGKIVWTYTHGWREVLRKFWRKVSVLASCESIADIKEARSLGYATAIVVPKHPSRKAYYMGDEKIIPCPEQTTKGITCDKCRLCWDDQKLIALKATIGFEAHGDKAKQIQAKLS